MPICVSLMPRRCLARAAAGASIDRSWGMTTLTFPARLEQDTRLRPVPWRRMGWVIWRHHRVALAGVVAFLGALAVWLWITGLSVHHEYAAAVACRPVGSANCTNLAIIFDSTNSFLKGGFVLQPVPR